MADDSAIITIDDILQAGFCASGARRWFHSYGLDFRDFMTNGIPEAEFLATGDALAMKVVDAKRARNA